MLCAVQVRAKPDAVIVNIGETLLRRSHLGIRTARTGELLGEHLLETRTEREYLEAAGIGVGGARPVHESAKPARLVHNVRAGLQVEMVGVGEHGLRTEILDGLG